MNDEDMRQKFQAAMAVYGAMVESAKRQGLTPGELHIVCAIAVASVTLEQDDIKLGCSMIAEIALSLRQTLGLKPLLRRTWS